MKDGTIMKKTERSETSPVVRRAAVMAVAMMVLLVMQVSAAQDYTAPAPGELMPMLKIEWRRDIFSHLLGLRPIIAIAPNPACHPLPCKDGKRDGQGH